ncbi:hypothetical protein N7493_007314 [Penicillium malachiteum]|uniref:LysM domain-containing protein n=1 Tax=Penicillium malachiteum TaxID=1324776 RepID=A0AAD6HJ09_9EURO|nr:hypothetical protein N7493_007314 [Penicillium malachiteum]
MGKSSSSLRHLLIVAALCLQTSALQLFNTTPSGVLSACGDALTTNITCDELISVPVISNQQYIGNTTLESLCAADCRESLYKFRNRAESACGTDVYSFSGVNQTVQSFLDPLTWAYNVSCLTSGDEFCYSDIMNRNTSIEPCSDCFLQYEAAMLGSTYGQQRIDSVAFSSLLSSCSVPASSYPYFTPTATSATLSSTTVTAVATCTGTTYTVESGDTCESISSAHSIAIDRFITENHLDSNCTTLKTGDDVCLGESCTLYEVKANDTCRSILADKPFYLNQLLSWNPPPGSEWNVTTTNFTTSWNVTFVLPPTSFTTLPPQTAAPNYTTSWFKSSSTITNYTVTGTASSYAVASAYNDLLKYCPITFEDEMSGWDLSSLPEDCYDGLVKYCDPPFNATMPASTKFPATCSPAYYESTSTPSSSRVSPSATTTSPPTQSGIASNCDAFYVVKTNDTCANIVSSFGNFTLTQFYTWNPAIGTDCKHLDVGKSIGQLMAPSGEKMPAYGFTDDAVCIGVPGASSITTTATASTTSSTSATPSPLMPDTVADCTKYYYVVKGDTCDSIEEAYGITSDQFSEWNPYVSNGTDCQNLWLDTYICVGAPDSSSSTKDESTSLPSATTATQTATVTVPSPLIPSTDADCTKYHYVVDDEDCETIESQYGIIAAQFNAWNPYVGSDCGSLWLHYYVCVGV